MPASFLNKGSMCPRYYHVLFCFNQNQIPEHERDHLPKLAKKKNWHMDKHWISFFSSALPTPPKQNPNLVNLDQKYGTQT